MKLLKQMMAKKRVKKIKNTRVKNQKKRKIKKKNIIQIQTQRMNQMVQIHLLKRWK